MIKQQLTRVLEEALRAVCAADESLRPPAGTALPEIEIGASRSPSEGDYTSNIALALARQRREAERAGEIAEKIAAHISGDLTALAQVRVSGGFLVLRVAPAYWKQALHTILREKTDFGTSSAGSGRRALFEFVSANPNSPVTVTHARGGVIGDVLANLHQALGYTVEREFYSNDALPSNALSVFAQKVRDAENAENVEGNNRDASDLFAREIAAAVRTAPGDAARGDAEFLARVLTAVEQRHRRVLEQLGIRFDRWISERLLESQGALGRVLDTLRAAGFCYERSGALWLRTTRLGDDADRVLVRASGEPTYLASDLAYHHDKFERGYDLLVDVWGGEHGSYVARTRAGLHALGLPVDRLRVVLYQPVTLRRGESDIAGGRYRADALSLDELLGEIGQDAARFFLLLRPEDAPLRLDLELAASNRPDSPLRRIVDARRLAAGQPGSDETHETDELPDLQPADIALLRALSEFPSVVRDAARDFAPYQLAQYTLEIADQVRGYRASFPQENRVSSAILRAASPVLGSALGFLGIETKE